MHTAIQAKSIEQESPARLRRQSTPTARLSIYKEEEEEETSPSSGLAYKHDNMKLTNINRRAYFLSKERLILHS